MDVCTKLLTLARTGKVNCSTGQKHSQKSPSLAGKKHTLAHKQYSVTGKARNIRVNARSLGILHISPKCFWHSDKNVMTRNVPNKGQPCDLFLTLLAPSLVASHTLVLYSVSYILTDPICSVCCLSLE